MRSILFIHQGFPAQFRHIASFLRLHSKFQVHSLGIQNTSRAVQGVQHHQYQLHRGTNPAIHPLAMEFESKVIRADACAQKASQLKSEGFNPDVVLAHPAWGESLLIQDIWPTSKLLTYQEFFYRNQQSDLDFDPEFKPSAAKLFSAKLKAANSLLGLEFSDWHLSPTHFQKSTYPSAYQGSISVIHDGIDSKTCCPNPKSRGSLRLSNEIKIAANVPLITFANRSLEPYRGYHTLVRAIPNIQAQCPEAQILIAGATAGVSYGSSCPEKGMEWKDYFLREIEGQYDPSRVHFTGQLPYEPFIALLQRSDCHVYLTYPFVLSWSLLEAMSCGCPVVGSATAPVQEVIEHGRNGLLVDFFKPADLAEAVAEMLHNPERARELGTAARQTILERYELQSCLKQQLALIELVASGALSAR